MKLALPKLIEGDVKFALILNPHDGEFKNMNEEKIEMNDALKEEIKDFSKWIPTFILTNNYNEVLMDIPVMLTPSSGHIDPHQG